MWARRVNAVAGDFRQLRWRGKVKRLVSLVLLALLPLTVSAESWTLEKAIAQALAHSPDAVIAEHRIVAARAGLEQANSAFYPHLQAQSGYMWTNNPVTVFGAILNQKAFTPDLNFNDVPDVDNLNVKGSVQWYLYNGGRNLANADAAKSNEASAKKDAEAVRNTLAFEVSRAYFTVWKTREFIKAGHAAVNSFENSLSIANRRLAQETILQSEVLDVEVRLSQAREDLIRAQNAKELAERVLRNLLGLEDGDFQVSEEIPVLITPAKADAGDRPEIQSVKHMEEAALAKRRAAQGGYIPRVSAFSSVDYNKGWELDGDGTSYTAGVQAEWDIFDGFKTRGQVREAEAALNTTREMERKLRLGIDLEREQARLNLEEAEQRVSVTEKAVQQAEGSVGLTKARFDQGLVITTQLIDAQVALTAARVRNAEARADRLIAIAALRKAYGLPVI